MAGGPGARPLPSGAAAAAAARAAGKTAPTTGLRGGAFEYSFEQDGLIGELAKNIRTVSWVLLALAALLIVRSAVPLLDAFKTRNFGALLDPTVALLGAAVLAYSFFGLRQAGSNFALIPESQGQDQQLTVQAFRALNKLFSALSLIVIVVGALVALSFIISVLSTAGGKPSKKKETPKTAGATAAVRLEPRPTLAFSGANPPGHPAEHTG
jgi:Na+/proline symporter